MLRSCGDLTCLPPCAAPDTTSPLVGGGPRWVCGNMVYAWFEPGSNVVVLAWGPESAAPAMCPAAAASLQPHLKQFDRAGDCEVLLSRCGVWWHCSIRAPLTATPKTARCSQHSANYAWLQQRTLAGLHELTDQSLGLLITSMPTV